MGDGGRGCCIGIQMTEELDPHIDVDREKRHEDERKSERSAYPLAPDHKWGR